MYSGRLNVGLATTAPAEIHVKTTGTLDFEDGKYQWAHK